jgi:hypothetical protein
LRISRAGEFIFPMLTGKAAERQSRAETNRS